jgi:hypothetical protein
MMFFGLPLWALLLIAIVVIFIGWKIVKFALTALILLIVVVAIVMFADLLWPHLETLL